MSQQPPPPQRQLRLEIPANLNATYANAAIVNQTASEIILDFIQVLPNDPRAHLQQRVVMTPLNAKLFLKALETNLGHYEKAHGEIVLPSQPVSLAEQLFGGVKPPETDPESGTTNG